MFAALRVEVRVSPARVILPLRAFGPRTRQMLAIVCVSACALLQFGVTPHTHTHIRGKTSLACITKNGMVLNSCLGLATTSQT